MEPEPEWWPRRPSKGQPRHGWTEAALVGSEAHGRGSIGRGLHVPVTLRVTSYHRAQLMEHRMANHSVWRL